jgi:signal peptidase I
MRIARTVGSIALIGLFASVWATGSIRLMTVEGGSMAPTLLWGDLILVNRAAYHVVLPFSDTVLASWRAPSRGDIVLHRIPNRAPDSIGLKRVVGVPGDIVEIREQRLIIGGVMLDHARSDIDVAAVTPANHLGGVVVLEHGQGMRQSVSFTPGMPVGRAHGPLAIPPGHYFLLGDNRDRANDSRNFGPLGAEAILGEVLVVLRRNEFRAQQK